MRNLLGFFSELLRQPAWIPVRVGFLMVRAGATTVSLLFDVVDVWKRFARAGEAAL